MMAAPEIYLLHGKPVTAADMAKKAGVDVHTIYNRLHKMGLPPEEAVCMPYYSKRRFRLGGRLVLGRDVEEALSYSISIFYHRAKRHGTTVQEEIDREYERQKGGNANDS